MCWRPALFPTKLLAVALILSTLVLRLDARYLKINKQPPGTVGIVPSDEDGESVHFGPLSSDSEEIDREKESEMISVKLLNQFHTRSYGAADQLDDSETIPTDGRSLPIGPDYKTVNQLDKTDDTMDAALPRPHSADETDVVDVQENVIEDDFVPIVPIINNRLPSKTLSLPGRVDSASGNRSMSTTLTTTTTRTTISTTTVRKVRRKLRQQSIVTSSSQPASTTTSRSLPTPSSTVKSTTTSRKPRAPRIDITKLNLEHLENELVPFPDLVPPQALTHDSVSSATRLLPRSIRPANVVQPPEQVPACGCQHRKRSVSKHQYLSEENSDVAGDYGDYDYDYNDVRQNAAPYGKLPDRPMLFPAMSRLLNTASTEPLESSIERAEKVHGTLERLMGIVTIFSHVDEFIQRKTKQSIRRLARLYESEEVY